MQAYPFSMLKRNSCTVISFFILELKQKGKEKIQIQGNVPLHQQPGALGALFMPPVQNSLWQLPNHCYPSIPSWRVLCSVLGSSVGSPKGNPLLLPTSEPTLHPVVQRSACVAGCGFGSSRCSSRERGGEYYRTTIFDQLKPTVKLPWVSYSL